MQFRLILAFVLVQMASSVHSYGQQRMQEREQEFLETKPLINEPLPDIAIYSADGKEFRTGSLKGHYTVLTFGCLTCPPSMWSIAGLEAVQRDYGPQGVQFYFVYKALAHPELAGNYVQPYTLEERLMQARQAKQQFGTEIPWLVDAMDNRFKHAMGDRPNSQFLISPDGMVVRKRAWANAVHVRNDLEELVGPVDHITREEDLHLTLGAPPQASAPRGVVTPVSRSGMPPVRIEPQIAPGNQPFFAKLRAEADGGLLSDGTGKLYLGFHLDPFQGAHWNNLTKPLSISIKQVDGIELDRWAVAAEPVSAASDCDPREFLISVQKWPVDEPLHLTVTYFACVEDACHAITQEYVVYRDRDTDGGGARGPGAGYWNSAEFARQLMRGDANKDGKLAPTEVVGIILPHFGKLDIDGDGFLTFEELQPVGDWLNHHHQPGTPSNKVITR